MQGYMNEFIKTINQLLKQKKIDQSADNIVRTALEMSGYSPSIQEIGLAYTIIQTQTDHNNPFEAYQFS